jgi:hypothetical protein
MKLNRHFLSIVFFSGIILCCSEIAYSQNNNTSISGKVIDSKTKEPLPFVTIVLENTSSGTVTDIYGNYKLITNATSYKITFSFVGYEPESKPIYPGKTQIVNTELIQSSIDLGEVTIKPGKSNYKNKGNPAVELINKVIDNKDRNSLDGRDFYSSDKYEKIVFSLSNLPEDYKQPKILSKFDALLSNIDSSRVDGKKNIPMFIKESQTQQYFRKSPKAEKEVITAEKTVKFDEYIDNKGLTANIKYLYTDINIYDPEIFFLSNKFLSPVAATAPIFYKYFIVDTSEVDKVKCIQLFFEPRNKADFLFHGYMFITADSSYAIKKVDMSFNKGINIDWVNDVRIIQSFEKVQDDTWAIASDDVSVDFGISPKVMGFFGQKQVFYTNYAVNEPLADTIFKGPEVVSNINPLGDLPEYWDSARISPLTEAQSDLYTIVDSIKENPAFRRRMDIIMLITTDFLNLGKVEVGPVGSFYSFNEVEGSRIKFGGRTKEEFSKHFYLDSYLAYGYKDQQYKYNLGITYSLNGKSIYKFPVKSLRLNYQYDTETPGQLLQYSTKDNLFLSFRRGVDDKVFYNRTFKTEYLNEFENHFSYAIGYNHTELSPGGSLVFTTDETLPLASNVPFIRVSEVFLKLRYSPKEEFYQGKLYRSPITSRYPTMVFQTTVGSKNLKNDYDYQKLRFGISKRFYFSIVGYTDIAAEAGKIFGTVPYPLLFIHNANQSYSYQKNSYNMMNFLEFASDQYLSLNIDHSFNGFFFNKVPLLKRLKFREVATLKMLYGGISDRNNPALNPSLFHLPTDNLGTTTSFSLEQKPYIEASIGISNILRIFRVDLIKRFTYLNNPNVSSLGVRVMFRFDI